MSKATRPCPPARWQPAIRELEFERAVDNYRRSLERLVGLPPEALRNESPTTGAAVDALRYAVTWQAWSDMVRRSSVPGR